MIFRTVFCEHSTSPSVWREWIEIHSVMPVVLRQECLPPCGGSGLKSFLFMVFLSTYHVSLRVEGVD